MFLAILEESDNYTVEEPTDLEEETESRDKETMNAITAIANYVMTIPRT